MSYRRRRGAGSGELTADDGPFAAFTDLFIGILFLFLILVAALMLMHQEAVQTERIERIQPPPKPAPVPKPDTRPTFRLAIAFNIYQRPADGRDAEWTFSRTVRVFRSPDGLCINTVMLRSNLSTAWRPPVGEDDIPTPEQQAELRKIEPCGLSASGDRWDSPTETGRMKRVARNLYEGAAVLHKTEGDAKVELQYRILGIYDDDFR